MSDRRTFKAKIGVDLTGKEGYAVCFDTDGINVPAGITTKCIGIIVRATTVDAEVCIHGDCAALAGGTVTAGKYLIPHTDGTVKDTASTGAEFALAFESGVAGDWAQVHVQGANGTGA